MLSKCRCPHTGVVNYFTKADPQLAVGSVAEAGDTTAYAWRCYVGEVSYTNWNTSFPDTPMKRPLRSLQKLERVG